MSFESPKIKFIIAEKGKNKEQFNAREKIKKKLREAAVWGFLTLGGFGLMKALLPEKPKSLDEAISLTVEKDKKITNSEKQELYKKIDYLKQQFGEEVLAKVGYFSENKAYARPKNPKINGFNKLRPDIDDKILKNIWNENYYPEGWINERVKEVEYVGEETAVSDRYGHDAKEWKAAAQFNSREVEKGKILFFRPAGSLYRNASAQEAVRALDIYFSHELGHANDWIEEDLNFKQRVEFLYDVTQQCFRQGGLTTAYVDSIKNEDPQKERYYKATEYWAEMCKIYFGIPEKLKKADYEGV